VVALAAASASAQSLAEIANREQERRKAIKTPSKVYTNQDLRQTTPLSVARAPAATPASGPATPSLAAAPSPPAAVPPPDEPVRDEQYWRTRINAARVGLERSQVLLQALQSRVNALATDFVNRDDPYQQAAIAVDRQRTLDEMDRVKAEIAGHTREIADIEEEARRAGAPPGWLR
jgi:hypothetical protein